MLQAKALRGQQDDWDATKAHTSFERIVRFRVNNSFFQYADEALDAGAKVAVCSTSNEKAVQKIVDVMLDPTVGPQIKVFAGDIVSNKKPDPAIYHLAAQELGVEPSRYDADRHNISY